jgi:Fe-S-cluster-containing hydrogenase component 2
MKTLTVDIEKCSGCRMCELVCAFNKEKRIVPHLGRVNVFFDWNKGLSMPVVCYHCIDAPCIKVCPTGALSRNKETNAVVVNEKICIGCRQCVNICPYGGVVFSSEKNKIIKCDLCDGYPVCVNFCPTGAIKFEEPEKYSVKKRRSVADRLLREAQK